MQSLIDIILLEHYNTRVVVVSTAIFGASAGLVGSFLLLRKRALIGDALSHATLPGVVFMFLLLTVLGKDGRSLPWLLLGATCSGLLGMLMVGWLSIQTTLKEDAAMGIVLSFFFAIGTALLTAIQRMPTGNKAGLSHFIYGQTASVILHDLYLISGTSLVVILLCTLLFKELRLLCFDLQFTQSLGWSVRWLDGILFLLACAVTVVGLQAVGLILVLAMLVIPPAAARFWSYKLSTMVWLAALFGCLSGWLGASISALIHNMPAGAIIVLTAATIFFISMCFGSYRGVAIRFWRQWQQRRQHALENLLRAMYEQYELLNINTELNPNNPFHIPSDEGISFKRLLAMRSWRKKALASQIKRGIRQGLLRETWVDLEKGRRPRFFLTKSGLSAASRLVRNHRLWETYLMTHADIAPNHVDRDADMVEHVLGHTLVAQLEALFLENFPGKHLPTVIHHDSVDMEAIDQLQEAS